MNKLIACNLCCLKNLLEKIPQVKVMVFYIKIECFKIKVKYIVYDSLSFIFYFICLYILLIINNERFVSDKILYRNVKRR